jgi:LysM repeat protein
MATVHPFPGTSDPSQHASPRKNVRLRATRRGRTVLFALAFAAGILVALGVVFGAGLPQALAGAEEPPAQVTVQEGDTLWDLAADYGDQDTDPGAFVDEVRSLNSLPTGRLTVGQQIVLPEDSVSAR